MSKYRLIRPGISILGSDRFALVTPEYPFRYEDAKIGDTAYVIVKNDDDDLAIDTTTIVEVSDFYQDAVATYKYRKAILAGEIEWPIFEGERIQLSEEDIQEPVESSSYAIDFWIDKYNPGYGLNFGEALYGSFEEAKAVFVQYFAGDYKTFREVLFASETDLRPE